MGVTDIDYAKELDREDELRDFRKQFVIDDPELIYLDGNSLGRLPIRSAERIRHVVEQEWAGRLIRGWNEGWFHSSQRVGAKIARLVGAYEDEVIVADSTSINLYKLIVAALQQSGDRKNVVTDALNFPSDLYIAQGALRFLADRPEGGGQLVTVPSADGISVSHDDLIAAIDARTAVVMLTHSAFKSSFLYDMEAITKAAHLAGSLIVWDVSHSVGVVPIDFRAAKVDLAVGCTYKFLNGGPGAPSFLYIRRDLQGKLLNPIWGWFGHRKQFDFAIDYEPATGIEQFLAGTPPILSLLAMEPGIDLVLKAGVDRIRAKSVAQSEYLIELWKAFLKPLSVRLKSPFDAQKRGSHVALGHEEGLRINRALIEDMRVIGDFRHPDNIRFGIAPLYTSFMDIYEAVHRMRQVIEDCIYERYSKEPSDVT